MSNINLNMPAYLLRAQRKLQEKQKQATDKIRFIPPPEFHDHLKRAQQEEQKPTTMSWQRHQVSLTLWHSQMKDLSGEEKFDHFYAKFEPAIGQLEQMIQESNKREDFPLYWIQPACRKNMGDTYTAVGWYTSIIGYDPGTLYEVHCRAWTFGNDTRVEIILTANFSLITVLR